MRLTEEQIKQVKAWRHDDCLTIESISKKMGCSKETIRCALDPTVRARLSAKIRAARKAKSEGRTDKRSIALDRRGADERNPAYDPYRDGPHVYASVSAVLMGDPPIGRSALERRA